MLYALLISLTSATFPAHLIVIKNSEISLPVLLPFFICKLIMLPNVLCADLQIVKSRADIRNASL
jgi:hypothetical protein